MSDTKPDLNTAFILELAMRGLTGSPVEQMKLIQTQIQTPDETNVRLMFELQLMAQLFTTTLVRAEGSHEAAVTWLRKARSISDIEDLDAGAVD